MKIRFLKDYRRMDMAGGGGDAYDYCLAHGLYTDFKKGEIYDVIEEINGYYIIDCSFGSKNSLQMSMVQWGDIEVVESVVDHVSILHSQVENKLNLREDIIMSVKEIKVGQMPGKIESFAVETGTTVATLLELAGLSADGFEVKADGVTVDESFAVTESTNMVLLVKKVKGNAVQEVKVGQMPGKIESFAVETGTTVATLLEMAGLSSDGFEIKIDGLTAESSAKVTASTNMVLLVKKVKGN